MGFRALQGFRITVLGLQGLGFGNGPPYSSLFSPGTKSALVRVPSKRSPRRVRLRRIFVSQETDGLTAYAGFVVYVLSPCLFLLQQFLGLCLGCFAFL